MDKIATKRALIIFFIIAFGVGLRLYNLRAPLLDNDSWRQTDTAAIALNFYRNGMNIFYPQVDWGGNTPGYCETEFQLVPYLVALMYKLLGVHDYFGRLISVLFSLGSMIFLYLLLRRYLDTAAAIVALFFFAFAPLSIYFSRVFMPDPAMLFFSISSLYYFTLWFEENKLRHAILSAVFLSLGLLVKVSMLFMGFPFLCLCLIKRGRSALWDWRLWLFASASLVPVILWYWHAQRIAAESGLSFGVTNMAFHTGFASSLLSTEFAYRMAGRFVSRILTPTGCVFAVVGLIIKPKAREELVLYAWLGGFILFTLVASRTSLGHDYYQLPFVPVAAGFVGKGFIYFKRSLENLAIDNAPFWWGPLRSSVVYLSLLTVPLFSIASLFPYQFRHEGFISFSVKAIGYYHIDRNQGYAAQRIKELTGDDELLLIVIPEKGKYPFPPTIFYFSQRKGWYEFSPYVTPDYLEEMKGKGARYLVTQVFDELPPETQTYLLTRCRPVDMGISDPPLRMFDLHWGSDEIKARLAP